MMKMEKTDSQKKEKGFSLPVRLLFCFFRFSLLSLVVIFSFKFFKKEKQDNNHKQRERNVKEQSLEEEKELLGEEIKQKQEKKKEEVLEEDDVIPFSPSIIEEDNVFFSNSNFNSESTKKKEKKRDVFSRRHSTPVSLNNLSSSLPLISSSSGYFSRDSCLTRKEFESSECLERSLSCADISNFMLNNNQEKSEENVNNTSSDSDVVFISEVKKNRVFERQELRFVYKPIKGVKLDFPRYLKVSMNKDFSSLVDFYVVAKDFRACKCCCENKELDLLKGSIVSWEELKEKKKSSLERIISEANRLAKPKLLSPDNSLVFERKNLLSFRELLLLCFRREISFLESGVRVLESGVKYKGLKKFFLVFNDLNGILCCIAEQHPDFLEKEKNITTLQNFFSIDSIYLKTSWNVVIKNGPCFSSVLSCVKYLVSAGQCASFFCNDFELTIWLRWLGEKIKTIDEKVPKRNTDLGKEQVTLFELFNYFKDEEGQLLDFFSDVLDCFFKTENGTDNLQYHENFLVCLSNFFKIRFCIIDVTNSGNFTYEWLRFQWEVFLNAKSKEESKKIKYCFIVKKEINHSFVFYPLPVNQIDYFETNKIDNILHATDEEGETKTVEEKNIKLFRK